MDITNLGTQLKLAIRIQLAGLAMDEMDFTCRFYTYTDKYIDITRDEMVVDNGCYIAVVDTRWLSEGELWLRTTAVVPDEDAGGTRTEISTIRTGIHLKK
ncbi:MAG: hypothetical protein LUC22_03930 [Prevotella sp.]|nr:hypothetical protein [Prevotella sp.]